VELIVVQVVMLVAAHLKELALVIEPYPSCPFASPVVEQVVVHADPAVAAILPAAVEQAVVEAAVEQAVVEAAVEQAVVEAAVEQAVVEAAVEQSVVEAAVEQVAVQALGVEFFPCHSLAKLVVVLAVPAEAGLGQVEEDWMGPAKIL
jgi:L-fucose mutarotase/ribose pyranase (RbsD/FucU family)